jgi:hypothetical protein
MAGIDSFISAGDSLNGVEMPCFFSHRDGGSDDMLKEKRRFGIEGVNRKASIAGFRIRLVAGSKERKLIAFIFVDNVTNRIIQHQVPANSNQWRKVKPLVETAVSALSTFNLLSFVSC